MDNGGSGIPGIFIFFVFVVLMVGIGSTVYRISTARSIARRNGMDEGEATAVALLNDNGLSAAYLRGGMQPPPQSQLVPRVPKAAPTEPARTPAERLQDLEDLHAAGKITDEEYGAAR